MVISRSGPPRVNGEVSVVTPSLATQLERCPLAGAFARADEFRSLSSRGSHFGALGDICHRLWEREARGDFDGLAGEALNTALNAGWDEAEIAAVGALRASHDGVDPPPSREWPGYLVKRLDVIELIRHSVEGRPRHGLPVAAGVRPLVEDMIEVPGIRLRGRPDRVVWKGDAPHIIDLKTCPAGAEMSSEHRRQLLAYAYLFHADQGIWPETATIQYVGGEERAFDVDPVEAEQVAAQMIDALELLNAHLGDPEAVARPSATACQWCLFKAACPPFFEAVDSTWELYGRHVLGMVEDVDLDLPCPSLTLHVTHGNVHEEPIVVLAPDPVMLDGISPGDTVAVAEARPTRSPTTIRCEWNTVVCRWDE